jgi:catechol 2,3-dioxygenase-like lactoylglutathione lyase family enzyme
MTTTLQARNLSIALTADDLERSLRFYTDGLGFTIDQREESDGKLQGVMLKAGDAWLGLSQDDFAKGRNRVKGIGMSLYFETEQDIHMLAGRAKSAGIKLDRDAGPLPWGPVAFSATDPDGFKITVMNPSPSA